MKHFRMLAAGLCSAVLLCGFAIPAYAYSDSGNEEPPVVEETPAPEPAPTITPGEGFSEDGNLVTRDWGPRWTGPGGPACAGPRRWYPP